MKPHEVCKYLYDMAECCAKIKLFTSGKTLQDYNSSEMLRSAVERQFEILGEALGKLLKGAPEYAENISNSRQIIAFRNILIHGYATVDDELVWGILTTQLPSLEIEISTLLKRLSSGNPTP